MRCRRSSRIRRCSIVAFGLASVVFLGAVDLHASALHPSTFETPHPVFHSCGGVFQPSHIEPAGTALRPAHEPLVLSRSLDLALPVAVRIRPSLAAAGKILRLLDATAPRTSRYRTPSLRAPPAVTV